jgi:hypothetical protein
LYILDLYHCQHPWILAQYRILQFAPSIPLVCALAWVLLSGGPLC